MDKKHIKISTPIEIQEYMAKVTRGKDTYDELYLCGENGMLIVSDVREEKPTEESHAIGYLMGGSEFYTLNLNKQWRKDRPAKPK